MSSNHSCDVIVIGAGAAGLAAARRLQSARCEVVVLEAGPRIGGRAHTVLADSHPVDLGCGWLHSAEQNPWVKIAEQLGFVIDRSPPPWEKQSCGQGFSEQEQAEFGEALYALFDRLERAGQIDPDAAASSFFEPDCRWNPLIDAISTYYNGVEWSGVSVRDFNNYIDTGVNWRVREGYGAVIEIFGRGLPVLCDCPASVVRWDGQGVRVTTPRGQIHAKAVIVAVPPTVLGREQLRFDPPLPDKVEAAVSLPLGAVEKVFLSLREPELLPADGHFFGRTDISATGSYHLRPFGRPLIECFFAGVLARDLSRAGERAFGDFAIEELAALLGADVRAKIAPLAQSHWLAAPFIGGAYSHALPGRAEARAILAAPVAQKLYFAGEACLRESFSTAHGALQSGRGAADALLADASFAPSPSNRLNSARALPPLS